MIGINNHVTGDSNCQPNCLSYNPAESSIIVSTINSSKSAGTTYYEVYQIGKDRGDRNDVQMGEGIAVSHLIT